jgi:hypothetical protein
MNVELYAKEEDRKHHCPKLFVINSTKVLESELFKKIAHI